MNRKLITLACIAFTFGLGVSTLPAEPGQEAGMEVAGAIEPAGKPCGDEFAQWIEKWGLVNVDEESGATGEGSRASIWLEYSGFKIKVNTMGGGALEGSFISEIGCRGGDIRGLFSAPGEVALVFFNLQRYHGSCGFLAKGPLDLPPPLPLDWINEIGIAAGTGVMLELGSPGVWFHESVNDYAVQDWVAVSPTWGVNGSFQPSVTYDMAGTGVYSWNLAYYGARTYPRPADQGFQYEACFRKNAGDGTTNMGLYLNGDGTMNNCIIVGITAVGGYYMVGEISGGYQTFLIPWTPLEPNLFADDVNVAEENVFNMVKANVFDDGTIDVYINQQYVASTQAQINFSGYVGLAIGDAGDADHVSCDNMTLSTRPLLKGSIADRKFRQEGKVVEPHTLLSPK